VERSDTHQLYPWVNGFRKGLNPSYKLQWSKAGAAAQAAPSKAERRAKAKTKGYEGEMCGECGHFSLVRNGTCMKCDT
jgi:ribonucleoside-diphosphate reductase alpha chain